MEMSMLVTTEIITSIDQSLAKELTKLFVTTFMQLPIYAGREQLVFDAITKEIKSFNKPDNSRYAIIAKDNGQIVGLIFIDLLKNGVLYLAHGAISQPYQQQGVAKKMLEAFLTRYSNITGAFTLTREGNSAAVKLYEKKGFIKDMEIYTQYPFLEALGYHYPPFLPYKITPPSIKKIYPGIKFNFSGTNGVNTGVNEEKKNDTEKTLRSSL